MLPFLSPSLQKGGFCFCVPVSIFIFLFMCVFLLCIRETQGFLRFQSRVGNVFSVIVVGCIRDRHFPSIDSSRVLRESK